MLPMIISGVAALGGGILNYLANSSAAERADALRDKALQEFFKINIPDPKDQELALKQFVQQGTLTPKMEEAVKTQDTEFNKIKGDQGAKDAQMRALAQLEDIGFKGGLRMQDKVALQEVQDQASQQERSNRMAIEDQFKRRGMGKSGFLLQAEMANQQGAADRLNKQSMGVASLAEQRALDALQQGGALAGNMRGQAFNEQAARASAQDAINKFNTSNLMGVNQRNVGAQNDAQRYNLGMSQDIADKNVNLANQQQQYNKGLTQQNYMNQLNMAGKKAGLYGDQGQSELMQGQQLGNLASNIGQGISGAASAYGAQSSRQADRDFMAREFEKDRRSKLGDYNSDWVKNFS